MGHKSCIGKSRIVMVGTLNSLSAICVKNLQTIYKISTSKPMNI